MASFLSGLDLKIVAGGLGALVAIIFWFISKAKAKEAGRKEVRNENNALNYQNILDYTKVLAASKDSTAPDSWELVNKLRSEGKRSLSEITDAGLREKNK